MKRHRFPDWWGNVFQKILVWCILFVLPGVVSALGLGYVRLHSSLHQPLEAEIPLLGVGGMPLEDLQPALASSAEFEQLGIDRDFFLSKLEFSTQMNDKEEPVVRVTTLVPVKEPILSFVLSLHWPHGELLREYTLLLSPSAALVEQEAAVEPSLVEDEGPDGLPTASAIPAVAEADAQVMSADPEPEATPSSLPSEVVSSEPIEPVAGEDNGVTEVSSEKVEETRAFPKALEVESVPVVADETLVSSEPPVENSVKVVESETSHNKISEYGPTQNRDYLWAVARIAKPNSRLSTAKVAVAIFKKNPQAFINGNMNRLRPDQTLIIPDEAEMEVIGDQEVQQMVSLHLKTWHQSASAPTPVATKPETRSQAKTERILAKRRSPIQLSLGAEVGDNDILVDEMEVSPPSEIDAEQDEVEDDSVSSVETEPSITSTDKAAEEEKPHLSAEDASVPAEDASVPAEVLPTAPSTIQEIPSDLPLPEPLPSSLGSNQSLVSGEGETQAPLPHLESHLPKAIKLQSEHPAEVTLPPATDEDSLKNIQALKQELAVSAENLNIARRESQLSSARLTELQEHNKELSQKSEAFEKQIADLMGVQQEQAQLIKRLKADNKAALAKQVRALKSNEATAARLAPVMDSRSGHTAAPSSFSLAFWVSTVLAVLFAALWSKMMWGSRRQVAAVSRANTFESASEMTDGVPEASEIVEEDTESDFVDETEKMPEESFEVTGDPFIAADVLEEADVYMTYKRYKEAESVLTEALAKHPMQYVLRLKLLELYGTLQNRAAFDKCLQGVPGELKQTAKNLWKEVKSPVAPESNTAIPDKNLTEVKSAPQVPESKGGKEPPRVKDGGVGGASGQVENALDFETGLGTGLRVASNPHRDVELQSVPVADTAAGDAAEAESSESESDDEMLSLFEDDPITTKLDLAKSYIDMGNLDIARELLEEVLADGDEDQRKLAKVLLQQMS